MHFLLFSYFLVSGAAIVNGLNGVNIFNTIPSDIKKGDSSYITWGGIETTDLRSLKIKGTTNTSCSVLIQLQQCIEVKKPAGCNRWENRGRVTTFSTYLWDLRDGDKYYLELEWIGKGASSETGISRSSEFTVQPMSRMEIRDNALSERDSRKALRIGGIIAIFLGVLIAILSVALYILSKIKARRKRTTASRELDEFGKAQEPLIGQDSANGDWSSRMPRDLQAEYTEPPRYESYKSTTSPQSHGEPPTYAAAGESSSNVLRTGGYGKRSPPPTIVVNTGEPNSGDMTPEQYMEMQEQRRRSAAIRETDRRGSQGGSPGSWTNV